MKEMVTKNRHLSLREIAAKLSVSHKSMRTILNDCLYWEKKHGEINGKESRRQFHIGVALLFR